MAFSLSKSRFFASASAFRKPMTSLYPSGRLPTGSQVSPLPSPALSQTEGFFGPTVSNSSSFHSSASRSALKEEDRNRDNLDEEYEQSKQKQFQNRRDGKAEWHEDLASSSEADVKADRGEVCYTEVEEMEKEVKKSKVKKDSHGQKSN